MKVSRSGLVAAGLLSFASLAWAGNIVLGRAVHAEIPPVGLSFWRWLVALVVLAGLTAPAVRRHWPAIRRGWRRLALLGLVGMALFHTLLYVSVNLTSAVNAALLMATPPVLVPLFAWMILGERPAARMALGTVISLAGVMIVIGRGDPARLLALEVNLGDLVMLAAVTCWSLYTVLLKRRPADVPAQVMLTVCVCFALVMLAPVYAAEHVFVRQMPLTWQALVVIGYVSLIASVIAFLCFNRGIEILGPSKGGLFIHLIPVFATLLAVVFLGEDLQAFHLLGIAGIAAGLVIATSARAAPSLARAKATESPPGS